MRVHRFAHVSAESDEFSFERCIYWTCFKQYVMEFALPFISIIFTPLSGNNEGWMNLCCCCSCSLCSSEHSVPQITPQIKHERADKPSVRLHYTDMSSCQIFLKAYYWICESV